MGPPPLYSNNLPSSMVMTAPPYSPRSPLSNTEETSLCEELTSKIDLNNTDPFTEEAKKRRFEELKGRVTLNTEELQAMERIHESLFIKSQRGFKECNLEGLSDGERGILSRAYYWAKAYEQSLTIHIHCYQKFYNALRGDYRLFIARNRSSNEFSTPFIQGWDPVNKKYMSHQTLIEKVPKKQCKKLMQNPELQWDRKIKQALNFKAELVELYRQCHPEESDQPPSIFPSANLESIICDLLANLADLEMKAIYQQHLFENLHGPQESSQHSKD